MTREVRGREGAEVARDLARLAELQELAGDMPAAVKSRKELLAVRRKMCGEKDWRTADARLALSFAEKVMALAEAERARLVSALRQEQEAARLVGQGKAAEAERLALGVLGVYRAALGPETAEVARVWHLLGRAKLAAKDNKGAKAANEKAVAIRRKVLAAPHPDIGRSLVNLGTAEAALGDGQAAKKHLGEAVIIWEETLVEVDLPTALAWLNLADVLDGLRDYAEAKKCLLQSLRIRRQALPRGHLAIAQSLYLLGMEQQRLGEYAEAKASYQEALEICRKPLRRDDPRIADSLNNLGMVQGKLGEHAEAKASFQEVLGICRKTLPKNHPGIAISLSNLGIEQEKLREYTEAKKSFQEALDIRRISLRKDHPDLADSLSVLGMVQEKLREYTEAKTSFQEALGIRRQSLRRDDPRIADSLNNLGSVQAQLEEYAEAKKSHLEALGIRRKSLPKDHPDVAVSLTNLGNVQGTLREYAEAKKSHLEALEICRNLPRNDPRVIISLNNLGNVQQSLGEYAEAKANYQEVLDVRRKFLMKNHPDIAITLNNLGNAQEKLREYAEAKKSHKEALGIRRQSLPRDDPRIANTLDNLGGVQRRLREYAEAKKSHKEALEIYRQSLPKDHPDIAKSLSNLGLVQRSLKEYAEAKASFQEALDIRRQSLPKDHPDIANGIVDLTLTKLRFDQLNADDVRGLCDGVTVLQRDLQRKAFVQAEGDQLAATAGLTPFSWLLLSAVNSEQPEQVAKVYAALLSVKGAVTARQRWAREARNLKDATTRRLLADLHELNLRLLQHSAFSRPDPERTGTPADPVKKIRELSQERLALERKLLEASPQYRQFVEGFHTGLNEVRQSLPASTALIDFFEYTHGGPPKKAEGDLEEERRFVAFVVRREWEGVRMVPLGSAEAIEKAIERWHSTHRTGKLPPGREADAAKELAKRLWAPLVKHLDGVKTVLYSPDGALNAFPLAALPGKEEGRFLIHDNLAFAVVPVPQLLPRLLRPRPKGRPSALLVGGIDFGESRLSKGPSPARPNLPYYGNLGGAEREIDDLRAQFEHAFGGDAPLQVLRKDKATKAAFLQRVAQFRYVHLATHGYFAEPARRPDHPLAGGGMMRDFQLHAEAAGPYPSLLSGLVFAGVNRGDVAVGQTLLTALEASELDVGTVELLVLSACGTGGGHVIGGEGVLGLQRAFQLAGVGTTVTSLWNVPDQATQALMSRFYGNLWQKGKGAAPLGKLEALREAQLDMIRHWRLDPSSGTVADLRGGGKRVDDPEARRKIEEERARRKEAVLAVPPFVWAGFVLSGDWR